MDFHFSEEQDAIRALAREILAAEASAERIKAAEVSRDWIDLALWKQCAEANLLGIAIAEEYGGMGMAFAELCVLLEEAGRATAPGPWYAALVSGALPLAKFGDDEQKRSWLPRIVAGDTFLVSALDDPYAASALAATEARRDGAGWRHAYLTDPDWGGRMAAASNAAAQPEAEWGEIYVKRPTWTESMLATRESFKAYERNRIPAFTPYMPGTAINIPSTPTRWKPALRNRISWWTTCLNCWMPWTS